MGIKDIFLQKGWAGRTISRPETVARINPLVQQHLELMHAYNYVAAHYGDGDLTTDLIEIRKTIRADIGKLAETVFSAGGTPPNGTDLEPGDFNLGDDPYGMLTDLQDQEQVFQEALTAEASVEHQMRTRAILGVVQASSKARLDVLKKQARTSALRH